MNERLRRIAELDRVIHEPARLMLVALLSELEEADFLYLLRETGMSKGNLSSHLSRLEAARYVEVTKTYRGKIQMTLCRLTDEGRAAFDQYQAALKASLDAVTEKTQAPAFGSAIIEETFSALVSSYRGGFIRPLCYHI